MQNYAELHCLSCYSFLRGASHPHELVERAAALGYRALAITDECSLSGVVRAHVAAKDVNLKLIIGAESTSWKARQIRANGQVSMTVVSKRGIWFLPWVSLPDATISFRGTARVIEPTRARSI